MVNNPPSTNARKWLYRGLFGLFGLAVIGTTFVQSARTANQQEQARNETHADQLTSQKQISYMTGKLDTISELLTKYANSAGATPKSDFTALAKALAGIAKPDAQARPASNSRMLSDDQARTFSRDISTLPPQAFFTITETNDRDSSSEQMMFTNQLSQILKAAKWTNLLEEINSGRIKKIVPIPFIKPASQHGIILYSPQNLMRYAIALANELDKFSIQHLPIRRMDMMGGNNDMPVDFIIIEVGLE
jgi:hypothetical protein